MAVPKRRVSHARRDKRRSSVWKLEPPAIEKCSSCGTMKLSHRLCPECGVYKGRLVVKKEED
jgi:large subunit ribosomal protein L32